MNFAPTKNDVISASINTAIDAALEAENAAQPPRRYLGGSRLGLECLRALGYEWFNTMAGISPTFKGKTLRRFRLGHMQEDESARWLRLAGFELHTTRSDGSQFGFAIARDQDTNEYRLKGHIDGCVTAGPAELPYPLLWEHKIMKASKWAACVKDGIAKSHPIYYGQCQTYMAYMELGHCLFMAWNSDTSDLRCELLPFDEAVAQAMTDRGVTVLDARAPEDLPRIAREETDYRCRLCDHAKRCWATRDPTNLFAPKERPGWLGGSTNG